MALRAQYESNNEIGCFTKLTNTYCIVGQGASPNYYSFLQNHLSQHMPVIYASIFETRLLGVFLAANSKGMLVPDCTKDNEMQHLRDCLPESVKIQRVQEPLSALGNVVACNDHVGLVHPMLDRNTEEIIQDVLGIETFRQTVAQQTTVGSYSVLNNKGALVHPSTSRQDMDELAQLLQVPVAAGTVNRGSASISAGLIVNDWKAFCGHPTTSTEISVIDGIFGLADKPTHSESTTLRNAIIDDLA